MKESLHQTVDDNVPWAEGCNQQSLSTWVSRTKKKSYFKWNFSSWDRLVGDRFGIPGALWSSSTDEKEKSHVLDDLKLQTVKLYHLGDLLHCSVPSAWLSPVSSEVLFADVDDYIPTLWNSTLWKSLKIQHHCKLLSFWFPWARKGSLSTPKTGKIHLEFLHPLKNWRTCGSSVVPAGPIAMTFSTYIKSP